MNNKELMKIREIKYIYGKTIKMQNLSNPLEVSEFIHKICCPVKEQFVCIFMNNKNKVLGYEIVSVGTINEAIVHPREVFRGAILLSASILIVAHNHPSGEPKPSKEDIETTKRLKESGSIIGIPLIDHIVVGEDSYYSFREENLI